MQSQLNSLVYVVDDDPNLRVLVERWLQGAGYDVSSFSSGQECLDAILEEVPQTVCLDLNMPGMSGLEVLEALQLRNQSLPVVMLTANDTASAAVAAMKLGAHDYLTKPLEKVRFLSTLRNTLSIGQLSEKVTQLEREVAGRGYPGIVGDSDSMKQVFRQMDRLTGSDISVIIHGESGTGKEIVAKAIHEGSSRRHGKFVAVNSAAIPESLLESELFGHEKGAFTGAVMRRIGKLEEANRGTLFLDEVGELSMAVQAKLLRVLQERNFQRVGGTSTVESDFRLLTATHRNLAEDVKAGRFREDLFFRLAVYELELPPLRHRKEDIPLLVQAILQKDKNYASQRVRGCSPEALAVLLRHHWPGNIRELQNVIQRAVVMATRDQLQPEDLPRQLLAAAADSAGGCGDINEDGSGSLEDSARRLLFAAIEKHEGNATATMRELNISRTRFYRMLKKFQLESHIEEVRKTGLAAR